MKILDIFNSKWAIDPGRLSSMGDLYIDHLSKPKMDFNSDVAVKESESILRIVGKTAIISIEGPLTPKASFFSFFFGGTSFEGITNALNRAISRPDVENIILHMDTPGGTVQGAFELSKHIKELGKQKDIQVFSDGMIASAGMLFASAASKRTISGVSVEVGSIGVISRRIDVTKMNEDFGIKVHEFVSGKFKNSSSPNKPMTEEDATHIQSQVDLVLELFAAEVSANLGITVDDIINMQAKTFIGQQAIDNGLVDQIGTLESLLSPGVGKPITVQKGQNMENENSPVQMTVDKFKADYPGMHSQIQDESFKRGMIAGQKRTLDIQGAAFPGQEKLVQTCIDDLSMSAGDAAIMFNQAEKKMIQDVGSDIQKEMLDTVDNIENATPQPVKKVEKGNPVMEYETAVLKAEDSGKVSKGKAMQVVKNGNPKLHAAYIEALNKR